MGRPHLRPPEPAPPSPPELGDGHPLRPGRPQDGHRGRQDRLVVPGDPQAQRCVAGVGIGRTQAQPGAVAVVLRVRPDQEKAVQGRRSGGNRSGRREVTLQASNRQLT